jgi:integrase
MNFFQDAGKKILLTHYMDKHIQKYSVKKTGELFLCVQKHLVKCFGKHITLSQIDKPFCSKFKEYLTTYIPRASNEYFTKFKQIINKAIDEELIPDMPCLKSMSIKVEQSTREYLSEEELIQVYNTKFKREDVKDAFLFSCFTGLRFSDIENLKFTDIDGDRLRIHQQKTDRNFTIKLHTTAMKIIDKQRLISGGKVFPKLTYSAWKTNVKKLCKQAGITRNITGHSARHTFGTRAYRANKDIYIVSKLLDHKNVSTTQIYVKIVEEDKYNSIYKLPEIEIKN